MKRFKEKIILEAATSFLNEASVYDNKYPAGHKFVVKNKMVSTVSKIVGLNDLTPSDIFIKIDRSDEAERVGDSGEPNLYFELRGKKYAMTKPSSTIGTYFNHYKDSNKGVDWKDRTLETAACAGLFLSLDEINHYSEKAFSRGGDLSPEEAAEFRAKVLTILGSAGDWMTDGVSLIKKGISKNFNLADIRILLSSMRGMAIFKKEIIDKVNFGKINFIHSLIDTYYAAEDANDLIKKQGQKANTADVIITNLEVGQTLDIVRTKEIKYNSKTGLCYNDETGLKMFQVSLKKGRKEAQLGKIFAVVKDAYGIPSFEDLLNTIITEAFLGDLMKKAKEKSKAFANMVKKTFQLIAGWSKGFQKQLTSKMNKNNSKYRNELLKKIGASRLTESAKPKFYDRLVELSPDEIVKMYKEIEEKRKMLSSLGQKYYFATSITDQPVSVTKNLPPADIIKLFANYTSFNVIEKFINQETSSVNDILTSILQLQKEMSFGKTTLPVYKVYGVKYGENKSYDFLGGSMEYEARKKEQFLSIGKMPVIGVAMNSTKTKTYYSIYMDIIYGVDEDGKPMYSTVSLRTNAGGEQFSFNAEGSQIIPFNSFKNRYKL